jgi:hypothetical protein
LERKENSVPANKSPVNLLIQIIFFRCAGIECRDERDAKEYKKAGKIVSGKHACFFHKCASMLMNLSTSNFNWEKCNFDFQYSIDNAIMLVSL